MHVGVFVSPVRPKVSCLQLVVWRAEMCLLENGYS